MADSLILMVLALVVFGPRRLPQIGKQLGKLMYEFRKASNDFKFQMEEELRVSEEADRLKREEEQRRTLTLEAPSEPVSATADVTAMNPVESPYVGDMAQAETPEASEATDSAASEPAAAEPVAAPEPAVAEPPAEPAKAEQGGLRIQPPSTGEIVAAERPGRAAAEAAAPIAPPQEEAPATDAPQSQATTEAVSQNG